MLTISQQAELASRLRLSVTRLARRLRQESAAGLTPSQTAALATVARHGAITPSDLAAAERIQRPTATRVIGTLAEAGLVERVADPEDGRSIRVHLTAAGEEVLARLRSRKDAYLARRLEQLDGDDLAALTRAAAILEQLLEELPEP